MLCSSSQNIKSNFILHLFNHEKLNLNAYLYIQQNTEEINAIKLLFTDHY